MIAPYAALSPARGHYVALVRALRMPANTGEYRRIPTKTGVSLRTPCDDALPGRPPSSPRSAISHSIDLRRIPGSEVQGKGLPQAVRVNCGSGLAKESQFDQPSGNGHSWQRTLQSLLH